MARGVVHRLWRSLALAATALELSACDSELITLGRLADGANNGGADGGKSGAGGSPGTFRLKFGEPTQRVDLGLSDYKDDNATLTESALVVYFTSTRGGRSEVYTATRPTRDDPFSEPTLVEVVNEGEESSSPAISLDGLSLWVGKKREEDGLGELDIWVTTRDEMAGAWSGLQNVTVLNSPKRDIPRPAAQNRVMPLSSDRDDVDDDYRIYLAVRPNDGGTFGMPLALPELDLGKRVVDGFLSEDLLTLFFSSGVEEDDGDLFVCERASESEAFGAPVPLDALNSPADERDPWLSPDGQRFFFTSNRSGDHEIFESVVSSD